MKKIKLILSATLIFGCFGLNAQVGIGTQTPQTNSMLDVTSTTKGLLFPRMTTAQRTTLGTALTTTPDVKDKGMQVYDTTTNSIWYWDGTTWVQQGTKNIYDSNGLIGAGRTVGVTDNVNFDNNTFVIDGTNNRVGIGTGSPSTNLDVLGSVTFRTIVVTASSNAVQLPSGASSVIIKGTAGIGVGIALIAPNPAPTQNGHRLFITNNTTGGGIITFSGIDIETNRGIDFVYNDGAWFSTEGGSNASTGSSGWKTNGNLGTNSNINYIGTNDAQAFIFKTSATERMRINEIGKVGIGNISPNAKLDIRTNTVSLTDPGEGMFGIGTTTLSPAAAGAGAVRYTNTSGGNLQYSNGAAWNTLTSTVQKSLVTGYFSAVSYTPGNSTLACTETVDINNNFNANVFTAPRTGVYLISANLLTNGSKIWAANEELTIGFAGSIFSAYISPTDRTGFGGPNLSAAVSLNAGDNVVFGKYSGGSFTVHANSFVRFSITEL